MFITKDYKKICSPLSNQIKEIKMIDKLFSYDTVFWLLLMIMIVAGTVALMMP